MDQCWLGPGGGFLSSLESAAEKAQTTGASLVVTSGRFWVTGSSHLRALVRYPRVCDAELHSLESHCDAQ